MTELMQRMVTGIVLLVAVAGWYVYLPEPAFAMGLWIMAAVAIWELVRMMDLPARLIYWLSAALVAGGVIASQAIAWLVLLLLFWFAVHVWASRSHAVAFASWLGAAWMCGWLMLTSWTVALAHRDPIGWHFIVAICFGIWASDIGAYFVGKAIGRARLCPAISPGKTVEGLAAGVLLGTLVAAWLLLQWAVMPGVAAIAVAMLAVFAGVLGDLAESALKRMVGVKDSGALLPGHGGILDRIDALVVGLPAAYLAWGML